MCAPTDVHSKCLLLPATYKPGTMDLDDRFLSPLPESVVKLMRPPKGDDRLLSASQRLDKLLAAYSKALTGNESPSWIAISILRPLSDW